MTIFYDMLFFNTDPNPTPSQQLQHCLTEGFFAGTGKVGWLVGLRPHVFPQVKGQGPAPIEHPKGSNILR